MPEDPWSVARSNLRESRARQRAGWEAERMAAQARLMDESNYRDRDEPRAADLESAVEYAIAQLEQFMRERGPAAQALLNELDYNATIVFGCAYGGGMYRRAYFNAGGIQQDRGRREPSGNKREGEPERANVRVAVNYFADYGEGDRDPDEVRNIVQWLTRKVDDIAAQAIQSSSR